jgi:hypothetical protein
VARPRRTSTAHSTGDYRHDQARRKNNPPVGALNDDLFDQLAGRVSLPFEPGEHRRIAAKVIDQRGNEVMRVVGIAT